MLRYALAAARATQHDTAARIEGRFLYNGCMIALIDYGAGNLKSVANACAAIGADIEITTDPAVIRRATSIILPGVGAFAEGMDRLRKAGLLPVLNEEVIEKKKPYLGICLGLQFLAEVSEEHGTHEGFGWIRGTVKKLTPRDPACKVPHIGWNTISVVKDSPLLTGVKPTVEFYFLHSFQLVCSDNSDVVATTEYGESITAVIQHGNIFATQFHPEKSQDSGLKILENFMAWNPT